MSRYKEFWYNSWRSMMSRCFNENVSNYKYYGAVGITVCEEWKNPERFGEWAKSSGWYEGSTLDRIERKGNYEPSNCRWADKKLQAKNRSTTVFVEAFGEIHNLTEWSDILGINKSTLINRHAGGDSGEYLLRPSEQSHKGFTWKVKDGKRVWVKGT